MDRRAVLRAAGEVQVRLCRENGSPTYAAIVEALLDRLDGDDPAVALLHGDPLDPVRSAPYLRLLGAVHRLAMADEACEELRAVFPSTGGAVDTARAVPAFFRFLGERRDDVAVEMRRPVQTNEVGRAAALSAAVNWVVDRLGGPVRLLEVGAGAGLNLSLDRVRVVAGDGTAWGPRASPLQLVGHFAEGSPPTPPLRIVSRRGCDLHPLDVADPADRLVLRSFVWPEDLDRLARLDAALAVAEPVTVDAAGAVDWAAEQLASLPDSATTVLFHSMVLPYLTEHERAHLAATVRAVAGRLVWVAMEPTCDYRQVDVTAEVRPSGERYVLATCTPHGRDVRWRPRPAPEGQ